MDDQLTTAHLKRRAKRIQDTRIRFRECLVNPLRAAILKRSPLATAQIVWGLPLELAAGGFTLTTVQDTDGWHVHLHREIDNDLALKAEAQAESLLAALVQLVSSGELQLEMMDTDTRAELAQSDTVAATAA